MTMYPIWVEDVHRSVVSEIQSAFLIPVEMSPFIDRNISTTSDFTIIRPWNLNFGWSEATNLRNEVFSTNRKGFSSVMIIWVRRSLDVFWEKFQTESVLTDPEACEKFKSDCFWWLVNLVHCSWCIRMWFFPFELFPDMTILQYLQIAFRFSPKKYSSQIICWLQILNNEMK